jgi:hypothetical protein
MQFQIKLSSVTEALSAYTVYDLKFVDTQLQRMQYTFLSRLHRKCRVQ